MLSFTLSDDFVSKYQDRPVDWGFKTAGSDSLGEITYLRTYSRLKEDGTKERWYETCRRCIEGMFSIQKDWCKQNRLPWNGHKAQRSAEDAYERMFTFKWTPPGRGLWVMGTPIVNSLGNSAPLQNCSFISTADMTKHDPADPFVFLMEASMLGIGVGFDDKGADREFHIYPPNKDKEHTYVIPDTREGWVESVRLLLNSYLTPGKGYVVFDYSEIRPAGSPIKTFGGTASGPGPLKQLHKKLYQIFDGRDNLLTRVDIADIGNLIGCCVVAGNVRRSAELLIGRIDDKEFINLKNPQYFPERNYWSSDPDDTTDPGWGHMSNNSVEAKVGDDYSHLVDSIALNGEPGLVWMDVIRKYGRLGDPINNKDHRAAGLNPCVTDDTWIMTTEGPRQVRELISRRFTAVVDGKPYDTTSNGFWLSGVNREVFDIITDEGWSVRVTDNHQIQTHKRGWVEAKDLLPGEQIVLNQHEGMSWDGRGTEDEGYLLGHLWGDGIIHPSGAAILSVWGDNQGTVRDAIERAISGLKHRSDWKGFTQVNRNEEWRLRSHSLAALASTYGMVQGNKKITDDIERASSSFYRGFLRAAFDTDGHIEGTTTGAGISIRLSQSDYGQLVRVQRMLSRLGIHSVIRKMHGDENSGYENSKPSWRLIMTGSRAKLFMETISFSDEFKLSKWEALYSQVKKGFYFKPAVARFVALAPAGTSNVYDVTVESVHAFDANGLYVHNCAEQCLESGECCTLVETFLNRHDSLEDFKQTLKYAFMYAKTVTLLPTHWQKTNAIMQRNRRIGCSVSGIANFVDNNNMATLRNWLSTGYATVQDYDRTYSEWLCVRESIKTTTVKPSGTVSILAGESPGVHWPVGGRYFNRAIRFRMTDPMVSLFRTAGYTVEPDVKDPTNTAVVYFPVQSNALRAEPEVSIFEKANLAVTAQRYWSDNSVSVTLSFDAEKEAEHVGTVLSMHEGNLKTVSFLPMGSMVYPQQPFTQITSQEYDDATMSIFKVDFEPIYTGVSGSLDAEGEAYCSTSSCEIKEAKL